MAQMKWNKKLLVVCATLICGLALLSVLRSVPVGAQSQPSADDSRSQEITARQIETFFGMLQRGNTSAAFSELLGQSPLNAPSNATEIARLQTGIEDMNIRFGSILHWERTDVQQYGADVIVMRYVLKYDQYPVIWSFAFYRRPSLSPAPAVIPNQNPWVVVELQFDTNLL